MAPRHVIPVSTTTRQCARCRVIRLTASMTWNREDDIWVCREHAVRDECLAPWREIDAICSKMSALLDLHDRDRFAFLLRYGS